MKLVFLVCFTEQNYLFIRLNSEWKHVEPILRNQGINESLRFISFQNEKGNFFGIRLNIVHYMTLCLKRFLQTGVGGAFLFSLFLAVVFGCV